jgi:hypothetical protein
LHEQKQVIVAAHAENEMKIIVSFVNKNKKDFLFYL